MYFGALIVIIIEEFVTYLNYTSSLNFEEKPDYV